MTTPTTQREADERTAGVDLDKLHALIADDGYAISFQSMSQYRTALLKAIQTLPRVAEQAEDSVVEANRQLLLDRSRVGLKKYGVPLANSPLSLDQVAQHALEEALDLANYLQTIIHNGLATRQAAATDQPSAGQVDERAAFERVYAELNHSTPGGGWNDFDTATGRYHEEDTHDAWVFWQKARASLTPTAPQAAEEKLRDFAAKLAADQKPMDPEIAAVLANANLFDLCDDGAPQAATTASALTPHDADIERMLDAEEEATTASPRCTCPSGDGSLNWPCPAHPPEATTASARFSGEKSNG